MHKAFLIYNPASGRRRDKRTQDIARVVEMFRAAGVEIETCATTHAGSAIQQVQEAAARGFDTVISCGGDGTANEALNGIMRACAARTSVDVALGLVPLGSGNLLASDLGLPSDPVEAAKKLLTYQPREFRPGVVCSQGKNGPEKRYFLVAAGVGADAELMYRTEVKAKEFWGRNAYFLEMARMALQAAVIPCFSGVGRRTGESPSRRGHAGNVRARRQVPRTAALGKPWNQPSAP